MAHSTQGLVSYGLVSYLHPTIETCNTYILFTWFVRAGFPHINKNARKRGRHGLPSARTLSARSYGLYGTFESLLWAISVYLWSFFEEHHWFARCPGLGDRKTQTNQQIVIVGRSYNKKIKELFTKHQSLHSMSCAIILSLQKYMPSLGLAEEKGISP